MRDINPTANTQSIKKLVNPVFSKAYCAKPGFKYQALRPYCKQIEFITDGFNIELDILSSQISSSLASFDPEQDCIVPAGTGIVNLLIGYYLSSEFPGTSIVVAFFQREVTKYNRVVVPEDYQFYRIFPNLTMEI